MLMLLQLLQWPLLRLRIAVVDSSFQTSGGCCASSGDEVKDRVEKSITRSQRAIKGATESVCMMRMEKFVSIYNAVYSLP